ncbi:uncharacterized protein LOC133777726 [Humulus lupulus]|uniref:uncharacterized protein LOC133777726 n=1 Tax=Humulus lupulus TaxID=3486 RepID=UPI002B417E40|nr:uncharacterized protein LOC133777726 [Humulus lupulus]
MREAKHEEACEGLTLLTAEACGGLQRRRSWVDDGRKVGAASLGVNLFDLKNTNQELKSNFERSLHYRSYRSRFLLKPQGCRHLCSLLIEEGFLQDSFALLLCLSFLRLYLCSLFLFE